MSRAEGQQTPENRADTIVLESELKAGRPA